MGNLFSLGFWFNSRPGNLTAISTTILVVFIGLLFVLSFVIYLFRKQKRSLYYKVWRRLNSFCIANTIIGIFLLFFAYELIPILSSRLWFLIWAVEMLIWMVFIYKDFKKIPEIQEKIKKEQEFKKYIP